MENDPEGAGDNKDCEQKEKLVQESWKEFHQTCDRISNYLLDASLLDRFTQTELLDYGKQSPQLNRLELLVLLQAISHHQEESDRHTLVEQVRPFLLPFDDISCRPLFSK